MKPRVYGHKGKMLRYMVEATPGLDAAGLVGIQKTITKEREVKLSEKLLFLEKQSKKNGLIDHFNI